MDKRLYDPRYEMEHVVFPNFFYESPSEFFLHAQTKPVPYDCYAFVCQKRFKEILYTADEFSITAEKINNINFCTITMPDVEKNFDCKNIYTLSDMEYALYFIIEYEKVLVAGNVNPNPSNLTLYYITVDGTKEFLKRVQPGDDIKSILLDFFNQDL